VRGGSEQDELKAAQSFEIPGRDLREDAAFFLVCRRLRERKREGLMTIGNWRKKIDEIDSVLLQLLNLRTEFAVEVARLKEEEGLSLCAPEREQKVIAGMKNLNDGPLDGEAVTRIFRAIMDESRRIQEMHAGESSAKPKEPVKRPSKLRASRRYGTVAEP
jgi:chorismate mutase-like protein